MPSGHHTVIPAQEGGLLTSFYFREMTFRGTSSQILVGVRPPRGVVHSVFSVDAPACPLQVRQPVRLVGRVSISGGCPSRWLFSFVV